MEAHIQLYTSEYPAVYCQMFDSLRMTPDGIRQALCYTSGRIAQRARIRR